MTEAPTHCGICLQPTHLVYKETHDGFTLWRCDACAGQFWDPMKNPGAQWYEHDERYNDRNADPHLKPVITHRLFLSDAPARGGEVFDIGMGTGNFLAAAQEAGYRVSGVDFDEHAIKVAKQVFGLERVYTMDLAQFRAAFPTQRFDVITLFEILEHVDNPSAFIDELRSLLKPGGYIAISVPYRGIWRPFAQADFPPRHLSRWSCTSMRTFLESHGFDVTHMKKYSAPFSYVITKFHFWTAGYLSFGMVARAKKKESGGSVTPKNDVRTSLKVRALFIAAKAKDYILFTIPALVLLAYLWVKRRHYTGLYVLARTK